jgi:hypothetical protein
MERKNTRVPKKNGGDFVSESVEVTRSVVEEALARYFVKKFKGATEQGVPVVELYRIMAKPTQVDMDSPEVQRLLMRVTAVHMTGRVGRYINLTQLYNPIYLLCKYCNEDIYIQVLKNLWAKGTIGLSIPDLERKVSRGGRVPRINGKTINFDVLNYSFKQVEQKLDEIFFDVCTRNNIRIKFDMGQVLGSIGKLEEQG